MKLQKPVVLFLDDGITQLDDLDVFTQMYSQGQVPAVFICLVRKFYEGETVPDQYYEPYFMDITEMWGDDEEELFVEVNRALCMKKAMYEALKTFFAENPEHFEHYWLIWYDSFLNQCKGLCLYTFEIDRLIDR